jgi:hypothetical protein
MHWYWLSLKKGHEYTFRTNTFRINFHPQTWDKVPPKKIDIDLCLWVWVWPKMIHKIEGRDQFTASFYVCIISSTTYVGKNPRSSLPCAETLATWLSRQGCFILSFCNGNVFCKHTLRITTFSRLWDFCHILSRNMFQPITGSPSGVFDDVIFQKLHFNDCHDSVSVSKQLRKAYILIECSLCRVRVTRWVCEKFAQNIAQPMFNPY